MSFETEQEFKKRSREAERSRESREVREGEPDPELAIASSLEKADILVKEVKSSKKQMQNIVINMQTVTQAIRQLRKQLQLADNGDPSSVQQDKKKVEELKLKIAGYQDELVKMRGDLIREEMEELKKGIGIEMSDGELRMKAEGSIDRMIEEVVGEEN